MEATFVEQTLEAEQWNNFQYTVVLLVELKITGT